jgi:SAM-dependent methyltransferase
MPSILRVIGRHGVSEPSDPPGAAKGAAMPGATATTQGPTQGEISPHLAELFERFDAIYRDSEGDPARIPWAHRQPCPAMVNWLNAQAPSLIRPGARVGVVGCGLGLDAVALVARGYDVTAFDVSESAIELAKRLHPEHASIFGVADAFDPPARLRGRFDLVVEVHTIQAVPPDSRVALMRGMTDLLTHNGLLLVVARGRPDSVPLGEVAGPPWELTPGELIGAGEAAGLALTRPLDDFTDGNRPPVRRLRGLFRRAS